MRGESHRPVAVITGASSGIGAEFARALGARRYDLVLVARRLDRLSRLAEEISRDHDVRATVISADLASEEGIETVARKIATEGTLELLVNNAGFGVLGNFDRTAIGDQNDMYRVHVIATMRLTHAALPQLKALNRGGVINVASVAGFSRMPGHASYSSTKAWIIAFTECLHLELRRAGSRVVAQALCPGYTCTEFHDVLHLDRAKVMPSKGFWMTPGFVVAESLKGFDRGRWLVVPGWRYRLLVAVLNHAPRAFLHPIVTKVARRREEANQKPD
jgi:uncharacterized protein